MVQQVLTSGTLWTPPADCPAGTVLTVETWGGGSGGNGRVGSNYGASGAGGSYASSSYTVIAGDVTNGIPYAIGAGSAGASGADSVAGGVTSFGPVVNLVPNSTNVGAIVNPTNTLPTTWSIDSAGLSVQVIAIGNDTSLGPTIPYIDLRFFGTTNATQITVHVGLPGILVPGSSNIVGSVYTKLVAGSLANITNTGLINFSWNTNTAFSSNAGSFSNISPYGIGASLAQAHFTATTISTITNTQLSTYFTVNNSSAVDFTVRLGGYQLEINSSPTTFQPTPGSYTSAIGGISTQAAVGRGNAVTYAGVCVGTTIRLGGAGCDYAGANGSGGGGAGGKDGVGGTDNGVGSGNGGRGDGTVGGLGGTNLGTSPGNPGADNVEGGGGGGGLHGVGGTAGAGGSPGGGGGGANTATGTGGAGATGQIRISFTPQPIAGSAGLVAAGAFSASGAIFRRASAPLAGVGSLSSPAPALFAAATLSPLAGVGAFTATQIQRAAATAGLAGSGLFSANASHTPVGTAQMAGVGGWTGTAVRQTFAVSTLAGIGSFTGNGTIPIKVFPDTAEFFAGSGGFSARPVQLNRAAAPLVGSGSFTALPAQWLSAGSTLVGTGSITAQPSQRLASSASFSGIAGFTANAVHTPLGTAQLAGAGSFAASAVLSGAPSAALGGVGQFTAAPVQWMVASAAGMSGSGTFSGSAFAGKFVTIALAGAGGFSASAPIQWAAAQAALSGASGGVFNAVLRMVAQARLSGAGGGLFSGTLIAQASAALASQGNLSADGKRFSAAAGTVQGSGAFTAFGLQYSLASASVAGSGALTATAAIFRTAAAGSLAGSGLVSVDGIILRTAAAALSGAGDLIGTAAIFRSAASVFGGAGTFDAVTIQRAAAQVSLVGQASMQASPVHWAQASSRLTGNGSFIANGAPAAALVGTLTSADSASSHLGFHSPANNALRSAWIGESVGDSPVPQPFRLAPPPPPPGTLISPHGHTFGGSPIPISAYFSSVSAANGFFGSNVCISLTDYTDWCIIKAALVAAMNAGGGIVSLPSFTTIYADSTGTYDGSLVTLRGSRGTIIRTQACGGPVISVNGNALRTFGTNTPLCDIMFYAFDSGGGGFPQDGGGLANSGYLNDSTALEIDGTPGGIFENLTFNNYDAPHSWVRGNIFLTTFKNCVYNGNNMGPCFFGALPNSFENMRWTGGGSYNNNYGFYFDMLDTNGRPGTGSLFMEDMSLDYNIVRTGYYDGLGSSSNDCSIPLLLSRVHIETNDQTSGITPRFYNNGNMILKGALGYEGGANPIGWIETGFYARTSLEGCVIPGTGLVPAVYTSANSSTLVTGSGNLNRYGGDVMLGKSTSGWIQMQSGPIRDDVRVNIAGDSNFQGSGWWGRTDVTLTPNAILGPSGLINGARMTEGSSFSAHVLYQNPMTEPGANITGSVSLKQGTGRYVSLVFYDGGNIFAATIDLQTGLITQAGAVGTAIYLGSHVEPAINGWYRLVVSGSIPGATGAYFIIEMVNSPTPANQGYNLQYQGTGLYNHVADADEEVGSFATSYLATGAVRP